MTMVERVARALYDANEFVKPWDDPKINPAWHPHYLTAARSAIEAMREPTDLMRSAGQWAISDNLTVSVCLANSEKAKDVWQAMISKALAETTP